MNVAKLLEKRRDQWTELEELCESMELRGRTDKTRNPKHRGALGVSRFATLYRATCADLALADAYQLPPGTVTYLHRLVARAHNQLYRADKFDPSAWYDIVFREAPRQIFSDPCVRVASIVFFGLFLLSMYMAGNEEMFPGYADQVIGKDMQESLEKMYEKPLNAPGSHYPMAAAGYIYHNTGIGLQVFSMGVLVIPALFVLGYNAMVLGAAFGYMSRDEVEAGENFFQFVTAHGPLELTAIALSAGGGLRLGVGAIFTNGMNRIDSIRENGIRAIPIMVAAAVMFVLAAFTEGFLSPSGTPYIFKAAWAIFTSGMISFYFVILGFPKDPMGGNRLQSGTYDSLFHGDDDVSDDSSSSGQREGTRGLK